MLVENSEKEKASQHATVEERKSKRNPKPKQMPADFVKLSDLGKNVKASFFLFQHSNFRS